MSTDRYQILVERTKKEFPRFREKERDRSWLRPIFWLLSTITRVDYSGFTTTIASTMYTGSKWKNASNDSRYKTLRHEKIHIKQVHCFPLGRWAWPVNHLIMGLCYIFILPFILTMRAKFEREGYVQTLLVEHELKGPLSEYRMERNATWMGKTFGGSAYAWMWRRKAAYNWAIRTQEKIATGEITNEADRVP